MRAGIAVGPGSSSRDGTLRFRASSPGRKVARSLHLQSALLVLIWYYQFERDVKFFLMQSKTVL
ncbi:hypothetical protein CK220_21940 [Mesorhizobium sp. WSM3860]|nr:hypothetical protein CK220_21940 [Mesorhizobium sp. WSM3860]